MEDQISLYQDSELVGWLTVTGRFSEGGTVALYWQQARDVGSVGQLGAPLGECESSELLRVAKHFAPDKPPLPPPLSLGLAL